MVLSWQLVARDELPGQYHVSSAFLKSAPKLIAVCTHGAGYDTVDLDACTEAGVLICNQTGKNGEAVAEHALGMMLSLGKKILEADRRMRSDRDWDAICSWAKICLAKRLAL